MTPPQQLQAAFMANDPAGVQAAVQAAVAASADVATLLRAQKWYFRPWLLLPEPAHQKDFAAWCLQNTRKDNPIILAEAQGKQGGWQEAMEAARLMAVAEEQAEGSPQAARQAQQDYLIAAFLRAHHPELASTVTGR